MDADRIFYSYSPFIREYIYSHGWQSLHNMQLEAARIIFETDDNLLLSSETASGKTEAAFFPILSQIYENEPQSFGVLYIAPLKSLINDQFSRITELTDSAEIPVCHWHGDVARSHKSRALEHPRGVLQITPESLEAMLIRRPSELSRLFGDLRYVIIDEIHTLTGTDRGNQILCQLARLSAASGALPRRIGLSATLGDLGAAAKWLGAGSGHETASPIPPRKQLRMRLGMEHFFINHSPETDGAAELRCISANDICASDGGAKTVPDGDYGDITAQRGDAEDDAASTDGAASESDGNDPDIADGYSLDPGFEYIYDCVRDRKSLVFSNSREETEYVTATLRQIAEYRGDPDIFLIHHGNLSAALREDAEMKMRSDDVHAVTCATVTMELGIDIGRLARVVQLGAPPSVSSFLQRLGRSGRRGDPPEMMMVFREEEPLPNTPLPELIPWELLRAVAVVQLYIEERFIEPARTLHCPFSLLFQQTLSYILSGGAMSPQRLAAGVLSLPPFAEVDPEDYRLMLYSMVQDDYLEMTDEGELIIGLAGERITGSFKFFAVFRDSEDFTVRCDSEEIGTIAESPPVGDRFALAGRVWEVEDVDLGRRLVYVRRARGKMEVSWPGGYGEIHTRILERMREVLREDTEYPYLKPNALHRLRAARAVARKCGMTSHDILSLGGSSWVYFPWLGTRAFRTMRRFIQRNSEPFGLSGLEFEGCAYMTFKLERGSGDELLRHLAAAASEGINPATLVGESEAPAFGKYDACLPPELLRRAYIADHLSCDEVAVRLKSAAQTQNPT